MIGVMGEILRRTNLCHGLGSSDLEILASQFELITVSRGQILFHEGDPGDNLYIVVSGKVKLSKHSAAGRENLITLMGPTDQFGELSLFDTDPHAATGKVVDDGQLARLSKLALQEWAEACPTIALQLLNQMARRQRRANSMLTDLIYVDVPGRLAKQLVQLADRFGSAEGSHVRVFHGLTQEELAHLVGASREHVSGVLMEFAARGWIQVESRSVVIIDHARLTRRALMSSTDTGEVARP
jgi:CRP/FNR family cyclic AMP-dependent transcriptional regulator